MAYVPDEAINAMGAISGASFKLYVYLCAGRNKKSGTSYPSHRRIADDLGCGYTHVSRLKSELVEAGWLEVVSGNEVRPLKGFPKTQDDIPENATSQNGNIPKTGTTVPKMGNQVPKNAREVPKNASAYKEEPSYLTSTLEPTHSDHLPVTRKKDTWVTPWLTIFSDAYELIYEKPYALDGKDLRPLEKLVKQKARNSDEEWLTVERFAQGVTHYFSSDIGNHTLADLAARFGAFFRSPLDRFNKPIVAPVSVNGVATKRETDNERKRREAREYRALIDRAADGDPEAIAAMVERNSRNLPDGGGGSGVNVKLLEPRSS